MSSPKTPRLFLVALGVACMLLSHSGVTSFNTSPSRSSATRHHHCSFSLKLQHPNGRRWTPSNGMRASHLASSFYDDFEDFEDFGEIGDSSSSSDDKKKEDGSSSSALSSGDNFGSGSNDSSSNDDAVMKSLRDRMSEMSSADDFADFGEEDDEEVDEDDEEGSGSALPDLEGNTLSSIDDLIGFAQAKARQKAADDVKKGKKKKTFATGTWEDENWANPIPHIDESTGELLDLEDILERGVVLLANPAKFCSDLAESEDKSKSKGNSFIGGLFDDPFPTFGDSDPSSSISPALLAKFGITLPPSPDLGPDRRADLLPVVILIDRDPGRGSQAMLLNRRTGNLMGDLPPTLFESAGNADSPDEDGFTPHPLAAFMIQPLWWAGSSPSISKDSDDDDDPTISRGGGVKAIDMLHACPYVKGCVPLPKADGLYWGGDPVQAQKAMKDERLEKPMSGFDFKFFIQTTRWLPSQLEQEIKDGTWYVATVSKEVLFRSRDRLGAKRAKPLWTEIIELLGDDYKHIRDQLYGEEDD
ncbi:hypothetical protein ACHAWT_006145 [Skeletonema menzelii]|eukprot:scaffold5011_cov143-Skeletonema_menzelii.AAC.11